MNRNRLTLTTPKGSPSWKMVRLVKTLEQMERLIFQHMSLTDVKKRETYVQFLNAIDILFDGLDAKDEHLHVQWNDIASYKQFRAMLETAYHLAGGASYRVAHYFESVRIDGPERGGAGGSAEDRLPSVTPVTPSKPPEDRSPPPLPEDVQRSLDNMKKALDLLPQHRPKPDAG